MDVAITLTSGKASDNKKLNLNDTVFKIDFNEGLVHQVMTAYMAGARSGNKHTLTRSQVRGGGAKPWRQKGTGRARAGSRTGPIWRGGGVTFAAVPRDHSQKVNKKVYKKAIKCLFSKHISEDSLVIIEKIDLDSHKTKDFIKSFGYTGEDRVLIIDEEMTEKLYLATRNLHKVHITDVVGIDPYTLYAAQTIVVTAGAMKKIEEWLV